MIYHTPLVSCETLFEHIDDPRWVVFDCRHDLADPNAGPTAFGKGRIPGAHHAHIDRDLAGPVGNGSKGRHPLPLAGAFVRFLRTHGVHKDSQVVCYDDAGGMWAGRLWWLLRHYGHENVAVLDGGLARWKALDLALTTEHTASKEGDFEGEPGHMPTITADQALDVPTLVDSRAPERYSGAVEPMDPVAGHIPGAINLPFGGNLAPDGLFLSPDELRARFEDLDTPAFYCGSGVTAAHNVLAMDVAGLPMPALYPGSWSEWCQPAAGRPVATADASGEEE